DPWPAIRLAQLAFAGGQPSAARQMLQVVSNELNPSAGVVIYLSRAQMDVGDTAGALATACRGLRAKPNSAELSGLVRELNSASAQQACVNEPTRCLQTP